MDSFESTAVGGFGPFCTQNARLDTFTVLLVTATPFSRNSILWFPVVCGCQSNVFSPTDENSTAPSSHNPASSLLSTLYGTYPATACPATGSPCVRTVTAALVPEKAHAGPTPAAIAPTNATVNSHCFAFIAILRSFVRSLPSHSKSVFPQEVPPASALPTAIDSNRMQSTAIETLPP